MKLLIHPTYFPSIATFSAMQQRSIIWEIEDNYQKQTYRNRCYICNDIGRQLLSIPIEHVGGHQGRQKYKEVRLDHSYHWQRLHWRTLQTAYRTSPFFEFYEDDLAPLFEKKYTYLLDFNLNTIAVICSCLQTEMPDEKTSKYEIQPENIMDGRQLVNAKASLNFQPQDYVQVFGDRHGFVGNLSILDLMFNEGTNTLHYLKSQSLSFLHA
ncbi:MAG: hypothetical protein E4H26_07130 [Flavobacteriales bacterium]|nr:MAG: hypothetical protein E4H26_07130 [Flavobacteriales bacterium]